MMTITEVVLQVQQIIDGLGCQHHVSVDSTFRINPDIYINFYNVSMGRTFDRAHMENNRTILRITGFPLSSGEPVEKVKVDTIRPAHVDGRIIKIRAKTGKPEDIIEHVRVYLANLSTFPSIR